MRHLHFRALLIPLALTACVGLPSFGSAKTIVVGPDQSIKMPSDAAKVAQDGDIVQVEPMQGGYFDCALWKQNNLTIEGKGDGVVITDKVCGGKGLFIINGKDVTIRNITFARARVADGNGAGIREQGTNLRIEHSRFVNNQDGILTAANPESTVNIIDSEFIDNGSCENPHGCAHGIYAGDMALLHIEHSVFRGTKHGHQIKSRARRTEVIGSTIEDGPTGDSSYLIDISNGGAVVVRDNTMEKGPKAENHTCAIAIGMEGIKYPTPEIIVSGNHFTNDMSVKTIFVKNVTATPAQLTKNTFKGDVTPLQGDGSSS